ncbi:ATP-binding protein [Chryseosolibacter indicus]|uniref:histidine kinase n=1 Tax=Chryseosolibacter indicus TaxID=2782351 RepID=A0ABS5VVB6_9BACT|nr:tetratricopeptide repeat-containing sensor histidine kinase [Chryseosolibacter indicus]MBT1705370.1 tetratricopeptide repeat-containing sensor histidine kinase [Chryseosolibacter indicus]
MKAYFLIPVLFIAFNGYSQVQETDSLELLLKRAKSNTEKVDLYNQLAATAYNYNLDKAYAYAQEAHRIAEAENYITGLRYALIYEAIYYYANSKYTEALGLLKRCAKYKIEEDDEVKVYQLLMSGNVFQSLAQYDSSEFYFKSALSVQSGIRNEKYKAYALKCTARLYVILWKNEEALQYLSEALTLYQQKKNQRAIADTWFSMGEVKHNLEEFEKAHEYVDNGCNIGAGLNDKFLNLYCYINRGELQFDKGNYHEALKSLLMAIDLIGGLNMPAVQTRLYRDIGNVYEGLSQNEIALKYYLEALKIAERIGEKYEIAKVLSGIGSIYKNQHNFHLAFDFINRSLALRKVIGDLQGTAISYNIKGSAFLQQKEYDSALVYLNKALDISKRIGYKRGTFDCLYNKALLLEEQKLYRAALRMQSEALSIEYTTGNTYTTGLSYNSIGGLYIKLGDYKKALKYLQDAERCAAQSKSQVLTMNNNYAYALLYEAEGNFKKALDYHKEYAKLNDSIYLESGVGKLAELQALYQVEKKDQEIELLNQGKQLQEKEITLQKARIKQQTIIIFSVVCGLILLLLFTFKTFQFNKRMQKANREILEQKEEIQAQSEELIEANSTIASINKDLEVKIEQRTQALTQAYKELDTFFYRASHDFRRPLTTFLGLAEVANITVKDPNALELFEKVKDTAINLDKMLVKLQSISDLGSQVLIYKEVLIKEIFDSVCNSFRNDLNRKNIIVNSEIFLVAPLISYPALVNIIIENMVENAVHFCGEYGAFIKLKAFNDRDGVTIEIEDNGQGIQKEYLDHIFDMYYRANERSKGNGLGLYIVKKAVERLNGTLSVKSAYGIGSVFTVTIPNKA